MPKTASAAQPSQDFSAADIDRFQQDGYFIARQLAPPALMSRFLDIARAHLAAATPPVEYEADLHYPGAPASREREGGHTIRRLLRAQSRDWAFTEWLTYAPLLNRIKQLVGPEVVMPLAHHNCIMTKQPRYSSDTGWHQDTRYWSFQRPELVNTWLALGPEREDNGCMRLIPASHRMELEAGRFDADTFLRTDLAANRELIDRQVTATLDPGDVLFFHSRTLHAATRNTSEATKYSVVFTFRPADNLPLPDSRSGRTPELLLP